MVTAKQQDDEFRADQTILAALLRDLAANEAPGSSEAEWLRALACRCAGYARLEPHGQKAQLLLAIRRCQSWQFEHSWE